MSDSSKFGSIEFTGKDIGIVPTPFDKLAISSRGELLLLSVFADTIRIKQMRAILCGGAKAIAQASGCKVNRASDPDWHSHAPGRLTPTAEDGYHVHTHKLGYGLAHAMFITRMPGFLKVVTEESLWQELTRTGGRYTTPLLREWTGYINKELRDTGQLEDAHCFNCHCGILTASVEDLDKIVSDGLSQYELTIPRPTVVQPETERSVAA